jgi:dTMP kinase
MDEIVQPALKAGAVVISDRMADSSLAYQGYGRGEDLTMINTINVWAMQECKPDLTFYMKIEPEEAIARLKKRTTLTAFEKEQTGFVRRLIKGFDEIFRDRDNVIMLDGTLSPKQVADIATKAVMKWMETKK